MVKTVACIIARTTSKRLPLKVLRCIYKDFTILDFLISRLKLVNQIDEIYLCTSYEDVDDILEDVAERNGIKIYRGHPDNIIERMLSVAKIENADVLLRVTGDNPLTSYEYIDFQIQSLRKHNLDYCRLVNVPIGSTAEVMKTTALISCSENMNQNYSEYLMLYMFEPVKWKCGVIKPLKDNYSHDLITIDTKDDLLKVRSILSKSDKNVDIKLLDILRHIDSRKQEEDDSIKIKLPGNKEISLKDFNNDMERRKSSSIEIEL